MENALARDLDHVLDHTRELWTQIQGERLFIAGGTGFVGTWLTESLLWANRRLSAKLSAVMLTRNPEAFRKRSPHLAEDPSIVLHRGDAADFVYPDGVFPLVVHAATERSFAPDAARPAGTFDGDVASTRRVLELARMRGTRRMLFTSSGAVYGQQPPHLTHIPEDYPGAPYPTDRNAAYGHGKRTSEFLCSAYAHTFECSIAIARLFAFVGPYLPLDENYAVGNFVRDALSGNALRIAGDGAPYRSYLYAADLAIWLWTILLKGQSAFPYNVGGSNELTIKELAEQVRRVVAPAAEIHIAKKPSPGAQPSRYVPATERAEKDLGLRAWVPLDEGIRRMAAWYAGQAIGSVRV